MSVLQRLQERKGYARGFDPIEPEVDAQEAEEQAGAPMMGDEKGSQNKGEGKANGGGAKPATGSGGGGAEVSLPGATGGNSVKSQAGP